MVSQKQKKKKQHERDAHVKVLKKREALRAKKKYNRMIEADVKATNEKLRPIINSEKRNRDIQSSIEHNLEILKELEESHDAEVAFRKNLNEKLESDGALTLNDKLDMIGQRVNSLADENAQITE